MMIRIKTDCRVVEQLIVLPPDFVVTAIDLIDDNGMERATVIVRDDGYQCRSTNDGAYYCSIEH